MTQEQKDLLLKDTCARLPYRIKASYYGAEEECETWDEIEGITLDGYVDIGQYNLPIECIKPCLFPLSSMTDELWDKEFRGYCITEFTRDSFKYGCETLEFYDGNPVLSDINGFINSLIKNHFDIYGLIPMGLADDATGLNIY